MNEVPEWLPTVDRIVELHTEGMRLYGGAEVYSVNRDCIDSALGAALNCALYASDSDDPNPLHCALHLFAHLNKGHCFTDGVKRASWMTFAECLLVQGLKVHATTEEVVKFVEGHAGGEGLQIELVSEWMLSRLGSA